MKFSWFSNQQYVSATARRIFGCLGVAILLMMTGMARAQAPSTVNPTQDATQISAPAGYSLHQSIDAGGHMDSIVGAGSMYDTMVNMRSGPRVLGQTFELHALPGNKKPLVEDLKAFTNGFGGDPFNFTKLDFSNGKVYEFSAMFRRDRQYFDYDLLGNPGIPRGYSTPIGPSAAPTGSYAWPQVNDSPFMFNTVRRMTDTSLTLFPLSKVTFRFAYSKNIFQGPSVTPSGNSVAGSEVLLEEYQRNSTDDFTGTMEWKPVQGTKLTYEQQVDHYKGDSYFTVDPAYVTAQESDGTKVALLASYQSFTPYGYSTTTGAFAPGGNGCNTTSMVSSTTVFNKNPNGGLPIIDPACNVIASYIRNQPTREIFPTETFRLQSTSIKNVSMNGDFRYTNAKMNLPNYNERFQGLDGASRSIAYAADASATREVVVVDYGIVWQATKTIALSDQVNYSIAHQPGMAEFLSSTTQTVSTTAGQETINYLPNTPTTSISGSAPFEGSPAIGTASSDYFGQKFVINNATVSWDATARATLSLTYRYRTHVLGEGIPHNAPVPQTCQFSVDPACGTITINENGGIFNVALRPASNWDLNGTVEMLYDDNVITPVAPRQTQHYRVHTMYRPKAWATISGAFNDLERHNNTNNTGTAVPAAVGPLGHVDHSRILSLGADLMPNEHYGFDFNYAYSDIYTATNICFQGAAGVLPALTTGGPTTVAPGPGTQSGALCTPATTGSRAAIVYGPAKDFEDAPTQFVSAALALSPVTKLHSDLGYRVSSVNGSRFFTDTSDVNGALVSTYQSPFVSLAYTVHTGLIWKGEYNYYGYGEGGGHSGAQYCNVNTAVAANATVAPTVLCSSVANTAMNPTSPVYGFTAPRNFHANNVTLSMHWEF